jgi:rubrerythrin
MAQQTEQMGMNRTGVQMSPIDAAAMQGDDNVPIRGAPGDERALLDAREAYILDADAIGSLPVPGTVAGAVSLGMHMLKGDRPQVLLDKLGERLAFERTGTRLYDALLAKCDVVDGGPAGMTRDHVAGIRRDEARHFLLLKEAIESLGGDPTAQTPSADVTGVESQGIVQVLYDPRTSLAQSLHALLTAELADRAGWETLIALAGETGQDDLVAGFTLALEDEHRHLALVQAWYHEAIGLTPVSGMLPPGGSAGLPPDASTAPTATPDVTTPLPGTDGMLGTDI